MKYVCDKCQNKQYASDKISEENLCDECCRNFLFVDHYKPIRTKKKGTNPDE